MGPSSQHDNRSLDVHGFSADFEKYQEACARVHWTIFRAALCGMLDYVMAGSLSFAIGGIHHLALHRASQNSLFTKAFKIIALSSFNPVRQNSQIPNMPPDELTTFVSASAATHVIARPFVASSLRGVSVFNWPLIHLLRG